MNGDRSYAAALKHVGRTGRGRAPLAEAWPLRPGSVPLKWRLAAGAVLGACAAAGVAYATARNPYAAPPHVAVILRVLVISTLVAAGLYGVSSPIQARMGVVLLAAGFYAAVWLLNGAGTSGLFTVGVLASGIAPPAFAYLMLAHPRGRLASRGDRVLVLIAGGVLVVGWTLMYLTAAQPPFRTPLLGCLPHCPRNALFLGSGPSGMAPILKAAITIGWTAVGCLTPVILVRRVRSAAPALRRALVPLALAAAVNGLLLLGFFAARAAHSQSTAAIGGAYVAVVAVIPGALLVGLALERLYMGRALAEFTTRVMQGPELDPAAMMAGALGDPSLTIAYERPASAGQVDFSGAEVIVHDDDPARAVAWIERDRRAVAAISYDARLADQARFVQAAGAAAIMRLETARLEADLKASKRELAASRIRLVEAADAERQRIERDIHDGVQQQLVGLRIKLDLAVEAARQDPARGDQMLSSIGRQMDELIGALRSLARGIYPVLLSERGLVAAVRSAAQRTPLDVAVRASAIERYADEIEVAVYFCCLEAIQNVVKHAGRDAHATVHFWERGGQLHFRVTDSGKGFDPRAIEPGSGLVNMRDRVEAVGGRLTITSRRGCGSSVEGQVPIAPQPEGPLVT